MTLISGAFSRMPKHYAIGVDLGGTSLRAALVSRDGEILEKTRVPSSGNVMASLRKAVEGLLREGVAGVGIGAAGVIDARSMTIVSSPNLPELNGKSFKSLGFDVPLAVANDANAAVIGEKWLGAGRELESFVLMTLGTGIGGGILHGGRLLDVAAEIGHMTVEAGGLSCPCGNVGCLERYASARAISDSATKGLEEGTESILREYCGGNIYKITPEHVYGAAREGDNFSREVLKEAGRYLGVGIANIVNILSPQAVILTGGLTGAWDIFVEEAKKEAARRAFKSLFEKLQILPSPLGGDDSGVLGAAALILHEQGIPR
jgi:glucokinase